MCWRTRPRRCCARWGIPRSPWIGRSGSTGTPITRSTSTVNGRSPIAGRRCATGPNPASSSGTGPADQPLVAQKFVGTELGTGRVGTSDPQAVRAGDRRLWLDTKGRLTRYEAVPPQIDGTPDDPPRAPDWSAVVCRGGSRSVTVHTRGPAVGAAGGIRRACCLDREQGRTSRRRPAGRSGVLARPACLLPGRGAMDATRAPARRCDGDRPDGRERRRRWRHPPAGRRCRPARTAQPDERPIGPPGSDSTGCPSCSSWSCLRGS